jgi:hypothetical protein
MSYLSNHMPEEMFEFLFSKKQKTEIKEEVKFRENSKIEIEKKPCPCMNKQNIK